MFWSILIYDSYKICIYLSLFKPYSVPSYKNWNEKRHFRAMKTQWKMKVTFCSFSNVLFGTTYPEYFHQPTDFFIFLFEPVDGILSWITSSVFLFSNMSWTPNGASISFECVTGVFCHSIKIINWALRVNYMFHC